MADDGSPEQRLAVCERCGKLCPVRVTADGRIVSHDPRGCSCGEEAFSIVTRSVVFDDGE